MAKEINVLFLYYVFILNKYLNIAILLATFENEEKFKIKIIHLNETQFCCRMGTILIFCLCVCIHKLFTKIKFYTFLIYLNENGHCHKETKKEQFDDK